MSVDFRVSLLTREYEWDVWASYLSDVCYGMTWGTGVLVLQMWDHSVSRRFLLGSALIVIYISVLCFS